MSTYLEQVRKNLRSEIEGVRALVAKLGTVYARQGAQGRADLALGTAAQSATTDFVSAVSPAFTGTPTAPTASPGTNTTQLSTTAFVQAAITALLNGAPGALDTLKELADAINDDASYAATITTALGLKAPLASPALTGHPTGVTEALDDSSTRLATTAYVRNRSNRKALKMQGAGILDENFEFELVSAQLSPSTGLVYGCLVGLQAGDVVSGVALTTATAGVGTAPTNIQVGLADSSGNIVAVSSNLAANAAWTTANTAFVAPFSSSYTVPAGGSGDYRVLFLLVGAFGTTAMQLGRATPLQNTAMSGAISGFRRRQSTYGSSVTTIAVAGTLGTAANLSSAPWMAAAL